MSEFSFFNYDEYIDVLANKLERVSFGLIHTPQTGELYAYKKGVQETLDECIDTLIGMREDVPLITVIDEDQPETD